MKNDHAQLQRIIASPVVLEPASCGRSVPAKRARREKIGLFHTLRLGTLAWLPLLLVAASVVNSYGTDQRLQWVSQPSSGQIRLQLLADPGPIYTIEQSTNLTDWRPVLSGPLTNGVLQLADAVVPGVTCAFYRGRIGDATNSTPALQIKLDPSRMSIALLTPETGGSCALTNDAGVRVSFTVGPSNVLEAVPVVMTLVSNLTGLPETEAPPVAVQFEPDGYEFYGSGTLEILYPTNLTMPAMSSFSFANNGIELHLLPDLVETNRILIDITHFSGAGTAAWTRAGRQQMQARSGSQPMATLDAAVAAILAQERQAERDGGTSTTSASQWLQLADEFWRAALVRYGPQALTKCDDAAMLARDIAAIEKYLVRYARIQGYTKRYIEQLGAGTPAAWVCNCVQEAQEKCKAGDIPGGAQGLDQAEKLRSRLNVGMSQLGACVSDPAMTSLKALSEQAPCAQPWTGTLVFIETYLLTYDNDDSSFHEHNTHNSLYIYQASVVGSRQTYADDLGDMDYALQLVGTNKVAKVDTGNFKEKNGCQETRVSSDIGRVQTVAKPQSATLHLQIRKGIVDKFDLCFPNVAVEYQHEFRRTWNRSGVSGALCAYLHPLDDTESNTQTTTLSGYCFNSKLDPTQFGLNSTKAVTATADFVRDDPSKSTDPITRAHYTGGKRIQLFLVLK